MINIRAVQFVVLLILWVMPLFHSQVVNVVMFFFDIGPNCVRAGLNWPFIMIDDENNVKKTSFKIL